MNHTGYEDAAATQLRQSLDSLHVAMGHARLYGPEHRETTAAMARALTEMGPLLQSFGVIELHSSVQGLLWRGTLARPEDEETGGLGQQLHREGIASLALANGIAPPELGRLLDVLRINFELPEFEEESLESLLWQADFQHVGFQAVSALMEAEALSGSLVAGRDGVDARAIVENMVVDGMAASGRRNLNQVTEEAVHRAVAGSHLAGLGGGDGADVGSQEEQDWRARFVEEGNEDAGAIAAIRAEVEGETAGLLAARATHVLLRAAAANRRELPPDQAVLLARQAVDEIHRRSDAAALLRVLDLGTELLEDPAVGASFFAPHLREFLANAFSGKTVRKMLFEGADGAEQDAAVLRMLVQLPDAVLQSLVEGATRENDARRGERVRMLLAQAAGPRIDSWLAGALQQPPERVLPTIGLARTLLRGQGHPARVHLLRHPSPRVQNAVIDWYSEFLDDSELGNLLPFVTHARPELRRSVATVLGVHKPYAATKFLRQLVHRPDFAKLRADVKIDLCITYGLVGGDRAVDDFNRILDRKVPKFNAPPALLSDLEAAARGLAAVGSVHARQALKAHLGGLFGPKKSACTDALERLEGGRTW